MSRFDRVLTNLSDQLSVPHSEKPKIIAEVAADLESFYEYFKDKGLSDIDAENASIEKVIADGSVLEQFQSLNTPKLIRVLEKLPKWVRIATEILVFVFALVPLVVSGSFVITIPWLARRFFVWAVLTIAVPVLYLSCIVIYRFYINYPRDIVASRRLLRKVLWFGFLAALVGFDGFLWEMFRMSMRFTTIKSELFSFNFMLEYVISGMNHLSIGLFLGVISVMIWIAGSGRLARIEYHEDAVHRIIEANWGME